MATNCCSLKNYAGCTSHSTIECTSRNETSTSLMSGNLPPRCPQLFLLGTCILAIEFWTGSRSLLQWASVGLHWRWRYWYKAVTLFIWCPVTWLLLQSRRGGRGGEKEEEPTWLDVVGMGLEQRWVPLIWKCFGLTKSFQQLLELLRPGYDAFRRLLAKRNLCGLWLLSVNPGAANGSLSASELGREPCLFAQVFFSRSF